MSKNFLAASFLVFLCNVLAAQKSLVWSDENGDFKKGVELFQHEQYVAAQELFRSAIGQYELNGAETGSLFLLNASYYDALCSKELDRPDAEQLLLSLFDQFGDNPITRRASFYLADYYFDHKKYDKALTQYKKVDVFDLSTEEKQEYDFQLGYGYFYKKKFEEAKTSFEQIKDIQGKYYYPSNYYYGYLQYQLGDYDEALQSFQLIENTEAYGNVIPYYKAHLYFLKGDYSKVIEYASSFTPESDVHYFSRLQQIIAKAHFEREEYSQAMPYFNTWFSAGEKATREDIYQLAYCRYKTKDYTNAAAGFKELVVLSDSLGQNALYLLGDCYLKLKKKPEARLAFSDASKMGFDPFVTEHASFLFAKLSHELNYHDVAVQVLENFVSVYENSDYLDEAKELLTLEFINTNNYQDALDVIRSMPVKSAAIRQAWQRVAFARATQLFNEEKDYGGTLLLLDESLKNPADAGIQAASYFWKGEAFFNQKKYDDALHSHLKFQELAKATTKFPSNVSLPNSNYTIGYCYLRKESYGQAVPYFEKVKAAVSLKTTALKVYSDAYVRLADCQFVLHNYQAALTSYNSVISAKYPGSDYALYQKAIILGLKGNQTEKLEVLKKLIAEHAASIYLDDAGYELGLTYLVFPSYQEAAASFDQLISKFPNSSYVKKAHLRLALIYYNLNETEKSLAEYKWVLKNYPKTEEGMQAFNASKEILIEMGDVDRMKEFYVDIPGANVTAQMEDSVMYLSAEKKYFRSDYQNAVITLSDYLNTFPAGLFSLSAHFYRAESYYQLSDFERALADYEYSASQPKNLFTEKSLLQAARISYIEKKDYAAAYVFYKKLSQYAEYKANFLEAFKGMLYSAYLIQDFAAAAEAAGLIIQSEDASEADKTEAHFYTARMAFDSNDFSKALEEFSIVIKGTKSAMVAESNYRIAELHFRNGNLVEAEKFCYIVVNQLPTYDYWLAKSYLLIASIFESREDYFQARSTLQSIIENYKGKDDILPLATAQLHIVLEKEAQQSKLKPEAEYTETDSLIIENDE